MGTSEQTGVLRTLRSAFAGFGIEVISLRGSECGFRRAAGDVDVVQVTAFDTTRHWAGYALLARMLGKPVVRYWVGSDVLQMLRFRGERVRARAADAIINANVAVWHNLRKELKGMGIRSRVLLRPHPPAMAQPVRRLPRPFTVMAYLSNQPHKWDLYGGSFVMRLAKDHPQWRFLIVRHFGRGLPELPNLSCLGDVPPAEMDAVYRRACVLVRMTLHDGLPRMILEALGRGLHVVWNQPFPHCHLARDYEQLCRILEGLDRSGRVNEAGSRYVAREFEPSALAERWRRFYAGICGWEG